MHRAITVFVVSLFISFTGITGAKAAPQILALLATNEPVPMSCTGGVCEAEFSTMCMQRERDMPVPGTAYDPADWEKVTLVVTRADGSTTRMAAPEGLTFSVPRTYVSVTAAIARDHLDELGAVSAAIEIGPMASLVPRPREGDTSPITAEEIERVTTVARMAAERALKRDRATATAASITTRMATAIVAMPGATSSDREALWDRVVEATPGGPNAAGVTEARAIFDTCQGYVSRRGEEGFRGCLQFRHDYLMFNINDTYWNRNSAGS